MKLLIVEDDEYASTFIKDVLESERYEVRAAATVSEAWKVVQEFIPDLVILDRGLPGEDGLCFCRDLKSLSRYARVPVLFLSGANTPQEIAEGLKYGDAYMTKPFDFLALLAQVQGLLTRGQAKPGRA